MLPIFFFEIIFRRGSKSVRIGQNRTESDRIGTFYFSFENRQHFISVFKIGNILFQFSKSALFPSRFGAGRIVMSNRQAVLLGQFMMVRITCLAGSEGGSSGCESGRTCEMLVHHPSFRCPHNCHHRHAPPSSPSPSN